jgi:hypothetical protein
MKSIVLIALPLLLLPQTGRAQPTTYDGRPTFAEGTDLGYYIWRDGEHWHVRWTTRGAQRRFTGSVTATNGELKSLKRIDVESETRVLYPGRPAHVVVGPRGRARVRGGRAPVVVTREQDKIDKDGDRAIVWDARTTSDIDGFDFKVNDDVDELRFALHVNGNPVPNLVEVGQNNTKPGRLPLIVRLR